MNGAIPNLKIIMNPPFEGNAKTDRKTLLATKDNMADVFDVDELGEAQEDLEECWQMLAAKYDDVFGEKTAEQIFNTKVYFREGFIKSSKGAMLGSTRLKQDGTIYVLVSSMTDGLSDADFYNVVLHEMCHCASFYSTGDLDAAHNAGWKKYADAFNRMNGPWHLTATCDVDSFN